MPIYQSICRRHSSDGGQKGCDVAREEMRGGFGQEEEIEKKEEEIARRGNSKKRK